MKVSKIPGLGSYGIFIDDIDFNNLSEEQWMEIGDLHLKNFVTIIRNTNLDPTSMHRWVEKFGTKRSNIRYNLMKKYDMAWSEILYALKANSPILDQIDRDRLNSIANMEHLTEDGQNVIRVSGQKDEDGNPIGLFAEGELLWHSNESGTLTFTPGVALLAAKNVIGSSTGFLTTTDYYESVSESFRSELDEMILIHSFTPGRINPGLRLDQDEVLHANMCPEDDTEIPLVMTSPGGIRGLHYSVNTISHIKGMSVEESRKVFDEIDSGLFVDEYIYDHWYENEGDLCLFDNSITLHRRLGDIENRLCYRIQHDYSHLQDGFWQPYSQPDIAARYQEEITDFVTTVGIDDFKLK